jgi:hypothetical protein
MINMLPIAANAIPIMSNVDLVFIIPSLPCRLCVPDLGATSSFGRHGSACPRLKMAEISISVANGGL